ncbi:DUF3164 family protein [Alcanivorax sp.]|uniref:DUF3164 family protein n=1 Tax=Alcanivorax sp. TaxID=1872427 RepID=UPI000C0EA8FF|nr:DUF3164 family protein [Alcanivorax sp.]PHR68472.1 MAG: sulfate transporter [Alcanivorax sp.]
MNTAITEVPAGYMLNAAGHLVPEDLVRDQDKLRDSVTRDLIDMAKEIHDRLKHFKKNALSDIADVVQISADRYDVKLGGKKGNVSLISYDGKYKVVRSFAERLAFTEELEAAKELINRCITRWSEGANENIRALVDRAFRTNNKGQLRTQAILELLRLEIADEEWLRAMDALKDSIMVADTAVYVRFYERVGDTDQYKAIPLDLAAV